ncbi:MAG: complex I NDUFA9 subunit family protein [Deltaproteobacteria bacterium]|nr:MAG: complex I NDUFA9 subunit family protein [Deltaproteobacteria bacterium]
MKVFVTGSTGFVGNHVLSALLEVGHQVRALVRPGSEYKLKRPDELEIVNGAVGETATLVQGIEGCDAVIHLVGIIRAFPARNITFERLHTEATASVIAAAKETSVSRLLHMSALGARQDGPTPYLRTKFAAEELVRESGLDYTIFRPSLIFGRGGEAIQMFSAMVAKRVVPIIGDGQYQFQPVSVTTVAQGFEKSLALEAAKEQTLDVGGPDNVTFDEIMDTVARVMGKTITKVHVPVFPLRLATSALQHAPGYPLTTDQITMLLEGSTCDEKPFYELTGLSPISLEQTLREAIW